MSYAEHIEALKKLHKPNYEEQIEKLSQLSALIRVGAQQAKYKILHADSIVALQQVDVILELVGQFDEVFEEFKNE